MVNYLGANPAEDMLVDDSATATITELGEGDRMDVRGHFFGACSLSVVVTTATRTRSALGECAKVFAARRHACDETYACSMPARGRPGNGAHNLRRLALLVRMWPI
jgi:hypothetical protein